MASARGVRPYVRYVRLSQNGYTQRRTFLLDSLNSSSSAQSSHQTLTASRTLPYPSAPIYSIIADIPSYSTFLPYCQRSDITKWSAPDKTWHRRWPSEGILTSGFGNITESFVSRVYCVPGAIVESVGGDAVTSIPKNDIVHHLQDGEPITPNRIARTSGSLSHLRSKWTVEPITKDTTKVTLAVEFAFANPLYAMLSGGAAPKVADFMVKAFEERVEKVLEKEPGMVRASLKELDGSRLKK